jgi:hypothetical protein
MSASAFAVLTSTVFVVSSTFAGEPDSATPVSGLMPW